jgi:hypothetical protein
LYKYQVPSGLSPCARRYPFIDEPLGVDLIGVFVSVWLLTHLVSRRSMLIAVVVHTEVTTAFDELRKKELFGKDNAAFAHLKFTYLVQGWSSFIGSWLVA